MKIVLAITFSIALNVQIINDLKIIDFSHNALAREEASLIELCDVAPSGEKLSRLIGQRGFV